MPTACTSLRGLAATLLGLAWPLAGLAQFELPKAADSRATGTPAPARLSFQYSYGMESPLSYRRNKDLGSQVADNELLFKTTVFGSFTYRPTDWLALTMEAKLGREYALQEQASIPLPNGDVAVPPARPPTLLIEQALVTVRQVIAPFEINLGRRNYEDERHWVFDGSMDVASLSYRHENLRAEAMLGRDVLWSLDALSHARKQRIETAYAHVDYRGIDNQVLSAYVLKRRDMDGPEGAPLMLALRGSGKPTASVNWWLEAALLRGHDENGQPFRAWGLDVGGTYRFANLPLDPNITLAFAQGSGDGDPNDGFNTEFRQTGQQTNEARYIGLSKFKAYGEVLDPELSNLRVVTVGLGARAKPGISIDLIYHRYHLNAPASEIRNWALSAQMNTLAGAASTDVGQALDLVVGFRGLFDIRRLGLDLRAGLFLPGQAFRSSDGALPTPVRRRADRGASIVAKLRY